MSQNQEFKSVFQCENCYKFFSSEVSETIEVKRNRSDEYFLEKWCKNCISNVDKEKQLNIKAFSASLCSIVAPFVPSDRYQNLCLLIEQFITSEFGGR